MLGSTLPDIGATPDGYTHPFQHWDKRSWIRSKPLATETLDDGLAFPLSIVPLANHPEIAASHREQGLVLAYRALAHLQFTTLLELEHVNTVCGALAVGDSRVPLTLGQRQDALRIYCDEGGHALFVEVLANSLEAAYGLDRSILGRPHYDGIIIELLGTYARQLSPQLLHCFFVAVSETLITKLLSEVPNDRTVASSVRAVLRDHAADEARHREFFRWYFPKLWEALEEEEQRLVGQLLPEFIWAFLGPDLALDRNILLAVGYGRRKAQRILDETYRKDVVAASVRQASRPTLKLFQQAGVLSNPEHQRHFQERQLWIES
jgi:hypothetical protein